MGNRQHFGPQPHYGAGPEMVHHLVHERAMGKTISAVYLGDNEPIRPFDDEPLFESEYLAFEFTDGTNLVLQVGAGNSFHVAGEAEAERILKDVKQR